MKRSKTSKMERVAALHYFSLLILVPTIWPATSISTNVKHEPTQVPASFFFANLDTHR